MTPCNTPTPLPTPPPPPPPLLQRRRSLSSPPFSTASYFTTLLLLLIFAITTSISATAAPAPTIEAAAQTPITPRRRAAFAHYNNQFFIQGGIIPSTSTSGNANNTGTGDLSALNLDSSWPTTTPAWTPTLANGNLVWHHALVVVKPEHSAGLSAAGGTSSAGYLLSVGGYPAVANGFFSLYNLQSGVWVNLTTPEAPYVGLEGHTAVSDPNTGSVYVMGGYYNNNKDIRLSNMLTVFDPKNGKIVQRVEATDATNMTGASAVWSSRRGTILLFEGSRAVATGDVNALVQTAIKEFDTVAGAWKTFETKGTFPTRRLDACAVESDDGAKIIYFGGAVDANVFLNTIHILDVDSGEWSLGQPAPTGARSQMACTFHGGLFVAFGGTTGSKNQTEEMYTSQPIVYDVDNNQWVDTFSGFDSSNAGSTSSGNSMDPVLWAGVGAIVFMMLCALVGDYLNAKRRRERKAIEKNARTMDMLADSEDHHSSRRRTIHRRANSHSLHRVMTPAEHYAAAQAAAELQVIREAALAAAAAATGGGNDDNNNSGNDEGKEHNRAHSWDSETFSQTATSNGALSSLSGDDSISQASVALARRASNDKTPPTPAVDPQMYYLHLLNQQRALQSMAPAGAATVNVGPTITTAGLYQQQQPQDRVLRSPQSPRMGSEILPDGGSSSSPGGGGGSAKAISFSLSSPPATPRRAPHTSA